MFWKAVFTQDVINPFSRMPLYSTLHLTNDLYMTRVAAHGSVTLSDHDYLQCGLLLSVPVQIFNHRVLCVRNPVAISASCDTLVVLHINPVSRDYE